MSVDDLNGMNKDEWRNRSTHRVFSEIAPGRFECVIEHRIDGILSRQVIEGGGVMNPNLTMDEFRALVDERLEKSNGKPQ